MSNRNRLAALLIALLSGTACASGPSVDDRVTRHRWLVTVYYTAVESLHHEPPVTVTGCAARQCAHGSDQLGRYPADFVDAVREEGTGRITSGPHAGLYLNWSHDVGYWLDDAPRDAHGRPLEPFRSAAADGLPDGTRLRVLACGRSDSGEPVPEQVCQRFRGADWEIRDEFTPGLGGDNHIDLYIGEQSRSDSAVHGVTLRDAELGLRA